LSGDGIGDDRNTLRDGDGDDRNTLDGFAAAATERIHGASKISDARPAGNDDGR
jgi:hypothetical protein